MDRRLAVGLGMLVLIASDVVLALAGQSSHVFAGVILWGLHLGLTQGPLASLVADLNPTEPRGTDLGFYRLITGGGTLVASTLVGWLRELYGAPSGLARYPGAAPARVLVQAARRATGPTRDARARPSEGTGAGRRRDARCRRG